MLLQLVRKRFRDEDIPAALRWLAAADGIAFWLWLVERGFAAHMGDRQLARAALARACAPAWRARHQLLRERWPLLGDPTRDPRATALFLKGLYPGPLFRAVDWVAHDVGGPVRGPLGRVQAERRLAGIDAEARWSEVTVHLGELLIALTQGLSTAGVPQASSVLGQVCHDFGVRVGKTMKSALQLPDGPASAIEVLRMSEYVFRVNPEHETGFDPIAGTGYIVGDACPWYDRPGWGGMHCGIFGCFQDGCCSAFGLGYRLEKTIPRHGGAECRVQMRPLSLRRKSKLDRRQVAG